MSNMFSQVLFVLLNGPPSSGKDSLGKHLHKTLPYTTRFDRFSMPLKQTITGWLGMQIDDYGDSPAESQKDMPFSGLNNLSYRQAQIRLSEEHIIPTYGDGIFGEWLKLRVQRTRINQHSHHQMKPLVYIVPDLGFHRELAPLNTSFDKRNILVVQLERPDTSFNNDSRNYVFSPDNDTIRIVNNYDIAVFHTVGYGKIATWLNNRLRTLNIYGNLL